MAFKSQYFGQSDDGSSLTGSPFTSSFLDGGNFLDSSRRYRAGQSGDATPILPGQGIFSSEGTDNVLGGVLEAQNAEASFGADALGLKGELRAAKEMAEAQRDAASSQASGARTGSIIGAVGSIGGAVAGALI